MAKEKWKRWGAFSTLDLIAIVVICVTVAGTAMYIVSGSRTP